MKMKVWLGTILISGMVIAALSQLPPNTGNTDRGAIAADVEKPAAPPADAVTPAPQPPSSPYDDPGFRLGEAGLTPSARAGREIWYKATAGNDRFHTYVFQQRVGVVIDWYRVLRTDERADRFAAWGLINDPGCCTPGAPGCPAKSREETYGFDWCPGDETLLS